ncbi:PAS domain S-box protein [Chloroflexota bacterium]
MKDEVKTKGKPDRELAVLRRRVAKLEALEQERRQVAEALTKANEELEIRVALRTDELAGINKDLSQEIVERKRAEEKIRLLKEKYEDLYNEASTMYLSLDTDGIVVECNNTMLHKLGYKRRGFIGKHMTEFLTGESATGFKMQFPVLLKTGKALGVERQLVTKSGEILDVILDVAMEYDEHRKPITARATFEDITERKQADLVLRESEEKFRSLAEQSPNMIFINQKGRVVYVNEKCEEIMGYKKEGLCSSDFDFLTLIAPESKDLVRTSYSRHLKGEECLVDEVTLLAQNSKRIEAILNTQLIEYEGETAILGIVTDITEHKRMEEEVRSVRDEYLAITNLTSDIIVKVDTEGRWTFLNDGACQFWGKTRQELLGSAFADYLHPDDQEKTAAAVEAIRKKKLVRGLVNRQRTPEGWRTVEWNANPILGEDGKYGGFQSTGRDITERKLAQEALQQSEATIRLLAKQVPCLLYTTDTALRLTSWEGTGMALLGIRASDIVGKTLADYLQRDDPDSPYEIAHRRALTGKNATYEFETNGRTFHGNVQPLRDVSENINGTITVAVDVTDRKRAERELRALSRRLVKVQEDERRTIAGELHDQVGQSLTALKLLMERATKSPAEALISIAREALLQVKELTVQVRNLSMDMRPSMLDDLGLLPALLWYFERYNAQTQVRVNFKHSGISGGIPVEIGTAIYRVIQEALTNIARHADVNKVNVRVWVNEDTLCLRVEDKGIGFNPDQLPIGTSAGISGMTERVYLLGGKFTISSAPEKGTTVDAELPLKDG